MIPAIFGNLPYLVVFLIGIKLAFDKRRTHPPLATLAVICYGILILLWGIRMAEVGWVMSIVKQGMAMTPDQRDLLTVSGYARMTVHILVLLFLAGGVFRWRKSMGDPWKIPAILVGAATILMVFSMVFGNSGVISQAGRAVIFVCDLAVEILVLTALFGWRGEVYIAPINDATLKKPEAVAQPVPANVAVKSGMFDEKDYIPYAAGVMILGGLFLVPLIWGKLGGIDLAKAVIPSLISCAVFIYAHDNRGNFSFFKFMVGTFFVVLFTLRALSQPGAGGPERPMFIAGGIVGYIIMFGCGWAGIAIGRLFRDKWNS